eukprot:scaffold27570_cov34-Tisochrysis_lutea.AAC.6
MQGAGRSWQPGVTARTVGDWAPRALVAAGPRREATCASVSQSLLEQQYTIPVWPAWDRDTRAAMSAEHFFCFGTT